MRWLDFAKGALLFLRVPGYSESGTFYICDRDRSSFYPLSLPIEQRYGGFRENEFESLTKAFDLIAPCAESAAPAGLEVEIYVDTAHPPARMISSAHFVGDGRVNVSFMSLCDL